MEGFDRCANPTQITGRKRNAPWPRESPVPLEAIHASDKAPAIRPQERGDREPNEIARLCRAIFIDPNPERLVHGADIGCLFTFGASGHVE